MIRQIAPQFFTPDVRATLAYYKDKLGFDCLGTWEDPPVYAIVARDHHRIHFRCAEPPTPNSDKYADELLDAYLFVEDVDTLHAELATRGVEFTRGLANTPWNSREFVVKDCDGRLLAFGNYHTETTPFDDALTALGPRFMQEVRKRLAPVKDRFFQPPSRSDSEHVQRLDRIERKDGLITTPPYLADPELRKVAIELAELAIENGIDVNIAPERDGSTFLHMCVLLHDPATAMKTVSWLLAHGADSNKVRDDGESPLSLAMKFGRTELVELMRRNSR
jgi:catechol 2,3-dioxygenase-like lactoylglutathione lyase family enzyme